MNAINYLKDKVAVLEAKDLHVANVKAKARKGRKALITWKKNKKASGYQIRYSTRSKFSASFSLSKYSVTFELLLGLVCQG
jgi:ribosomal protein L3